MSEIDSGTITIKISLEEIKILALFLERLSLVIKLMKSNLNIKNINVNY